MKCPVDNETLLISERQGVEIDYCPTCRGVWLDRGELDKILERSDDRDDDFDDDDDDRRRRGRPPMPPVQYQQPQQHDGHGKKKKKGWLSEMFELD